MKNIVLSKESSITVSEPRHKLLPNPSKIYLSGRKKTQTKHPKKKTKTTQHTQSKQSLKTKKTVRV